VKNEGGIMRISELSSVFGFECIQASYEDADLLDGYTSDLLSDVMAKAGQDSVLITIQAHKNTVAVASLAGIRAVVLCNARPILDDMVEAARAEGIALFRTDRNQFQVSGLLYPAIHGQAS
jgi:hypothetical protein